MRRGPAAGLPARRAGRCARRGSRSPSPRATAPTRTPTDDRLTEQHERRDADEHARTTSRRTTTPSSASPRTPPPTRSRRPTASSPASTTRTPTRATPRPRSGSRRSPRPTTCSPTTSAARSTTRRARCSAAAGSACPAGRAAAVPAAFTFDLGDLFGGSRRRRRRRPRRPVRRPVRRPRRRAGAHRRPRRGADIETEVTLGFAEAVDGATVPLRLTSDAAVPDLPAAPAPRPGPLPRACPTCEGTGQTSREPGRLRLLRAVPRLPRPRPGRRRPVPDLPRQRPGARAPARSTRGSRPASTTASASGSRARARRASAAARPATCYVIVHVDAAPGVRPQGRQPHAHRAGDVRRGGARRRDQGADPRAARRSRCSIPAGTANGRTFRVRGRGVARKDGTKGDLLVTVEVAVPQQARRQGPRGPGGVPRRDRGRRPARRAARSAPEASEPMDADHSSSTDDTPVYVISVAAQLSGLHPQTLRQYDRLGLVSPGRTPGRRPALLRARHRAAARGAAALPGRGRQPRRHQADPRARGRRSTRCSARVAELQAELRRVRRARPTPAPTLPLAPAPLRPRDRSDSQSAGPPRAEGGARMD